MVRILVTGASTGLGLLTANTLAAQGHEVILHARNEQRLYNRDISKAMADTIFGDLSNLDEAIGIAEQAENYGRFDAVVHNAGVINGDDLVPVNVVAPYVLTSLMTPPSRVIVLSSSMHLSGSPRHVSAGIAGAVGGVRSGGVGFGVGCGIVGVAACGQGESHGAGQQDAEQGGDLLILHCVLFLFFGSLRNVGNLWKSLNLYL